MNDWSNKLKGELENFFSMPFDVSQDIVDGEEHYMCIPHNEGERFFTVTVYLHNQIRLLVEIGPQLNGRAILDEMSMADESKKNCFFDYLMMLQRLGGKVRFKVNGDEQLSQDSWPSIWRSFSCKITKIPIETNSKEEEFGLILEWMKHGVSLIITLLNIDEQENLPAYSPLGEGAKYYVLSVRYERNPINRELCLYRKGYTCFVCGTNFYERYGDIGLRFVEVHHTTPVSMMGENYRLDIDRDLVPLCSNCHSMIHRKTPPYTVEELRTIWEEHNYGGAMLAAENPPEYNLRDNTIVGVVKKENIERFSEGKATLYYFGKRFPSKYNLKNIQYFAPYFDGGIRGYYTVKGVRTATKAEILNSSELGEDDHRIVLDLGVYHNITDKPIKIKLASYNYAFIPLQDLLGN